MADRELIGYIIIAIVILIFMGFRIVRPTQRGVVERLGRYRRIAEQGLRWVIPFIDRMIKVNVTEIRLDVPRQSVITKDNLNLQIDAVVYFKVNEVNKALYNVNDYFTAIPSLAQTTLRSVIGELQFSEVNAQRQVINAKIEKELDTQTIAWGIEIIRVELQDVQPSKEVQMAMDKVVTAEREKEAKITQAMAEKEAQRQIAESEVIAAEADKRAKIERAEGEAKAVLIEAEAKSAAIKMVNTAVEETFKNNAQKFKALEVTESTLRHNSKVILTEKGISPSLILNETGEKVTPIK